METRLGILGLWKGDQRVSIQWGQGSVKEGEVIQMMDMVAIAKECDCGQAVVAHLGGRGRQMSVSGMPTWSTKGDPGLIRLYKHCLKKQQHKFHKEQFSKIKSCLRGETHQIQF